MSSLINTLRPRQKGRRFTNDIFNNIILNENSRILIKISLKIIPKVRIDNKSALAQITAWYKTYAKPLSVQMIA